jgi:CrcB protein
MLESLLWVVVGAIFGALGRFLITSSSSQLSNHHGFPFGILLVNVLGCVIVGYVLTWGLKFLVC